MAVATFRRPQLLSKLLPLLDEQAREIASDGLAVEILVVDNDPQNSARPAVEGAALHTSLRLLSEPRPGLAAVRNRILDESGDADLLALIDDDEQPSPAWLTGLVAAARSTGATAVTGPVESILTRPLDDWTAGAGLFARTHRATSSQPPGLATNNLLLDMGQSRELGLRFDPRFGLTGGEDSMFGQTLLRRGGTISWCDESMVREVVPPDRLTRSWILTRATRSGETWVRVRTIDRPGAAGLRLRYAATGFIRWALGTLRAAICRIRRNEAGQGHHEFRAAGGLGMLRGALGRTTVEYSRD